MIRHREPINQGAAEQQAEGLRLLHRGNVLVLCDDVVRQSTRCLQAPGHGAPFLVLAFEGEALRLDFGATLARPRRAQHLFAEPWQVLVGVGRRGRVVERTVAGQVPAPCLVGRAARSAFDMQAVGAQAAPGRDRPELVSRGVDVLRLRALGAHALRRHLSERLAAACIGGGDRRRFDVERAQRAVGELDAGGERAVGRHQLLDVIGAFLTRSGAARRRP